MLDSDIINFINKLYKEDEDKFTLGKDIFFDESKKSLIRFSNQITALSFFTKPQYAKLTQLINEKDFISNINPYDLIGLEQDVGFIREISKSKIFDMTVNFAIEKGLVSSRNFFIGFLRDMWFSAFHTSDTSTKVYTGFGHVFVGEDSGSTIGGAHNWIRLQILIGYEMATFDKIRYDENKPLLVDLHLKGSNNYEEYHKTDGFLIGISPCFDICFRSLIWLATRTSGVHTIQLNEIEYRVQFWAVHNDIRFRTSYMLS